MMLIDYQVLQDQKKYFCSIDVSSEKNDPSIITYHKGIWQVPEGYLIKLNVIYNWNGNFSEAPKKIKLRKIDV